MSKRFLLVIYFIFNILDYICTISLIYHTGCNIEGNPIACKIFDEFGFIGMGVYKIINVGFLCFILLILQFNQCGIKYVKPILMFACVVVIIPH